MNEYCNCTQDKCSDLPNTVCNPDTGACECNEGYQLKNGKCEVKGLHHMFNLYISILSGKKAIHSE